MPAPLRVCAVSYLNTAPLVWGLTHGPQHGVFDLRFTLPSECADALREDRADIGLIPVIELARQPDLVVVPGSAIACTGPVRSILLISKKPLGAIESFAADLGSRSSVAMTQTLLARKHGIRPKVLPHRADLDAMLDLADAALIIGDPALRIDPEMTEHRGRPVHVFDMGGEWVETVGLPMVFAVWAVKQDLADPKLAAIFAESAAYGRERLEEIVAEESRNRDMPAELVRRYVNEYISYDLGDDERRSMAFFLRAAAEIGVVEGGREPRFLDAGAGNTQVPGVAHGASRMCQSPSDAFPVG